MQLKNPNRQIFRLGDHTLVFSIPMDLVRAYDIRPGQMVHMETVQEGAQGMPSLLLRFLKWSDAGNTKASDESSAMKPTANPRSM